MVGLVLKWAKEIGGLPEVSRRNQEKAGLIYKTIDDSGGFYRGHAKSDRSVMNVTFRLPNEDLEELFASDAKKHNLIGLKGHRSVGGLRASIYNALTIESVQVLVQYMKEFQQKNG
jgi:phosphoserine aminotransferase